MGDVGLMGVGGRIGAGHRDVDRAVDHDGRMHHRSGKIAIATIAGAVVAATEFAMGDRPERANASARCGIAVAAIAAHSRDLGRGLIEIRRCSSDRRWLSHGSRRAPR